MSDTQTVPGSPHKAVGQGSTKQSPPIARRLLRALGTSLMVLVVTSAIGVGTVASVLVIRQQAAAEPTPAVQPPIAVDLMRIEIVDSFATERRYVGRLEAARQTRVAFEVSGTVTSIAVEEGTRVAAGAPVAVLDTARLKSQRRQLEAQIREFDAQRQLAQLTLGRQSKLSRKGFAAEQRVDEARTSVAQATAAMDRLKAQIDAVEIDIAKSSLTAPFDGIVAERLIDEGAVVSPGTAVVTLLETAKRQARIGLPPQVGQELIVGQTYSLATPRGAISASLNAIRPDLQASTRTVTALFEVAAGPVVPFGEVVTLVLEQQVEQRGAWVPLIALKEGRRGLWTVLLAADPADEPGGDQGAKVVRTAAVEVLHTQGERAFVRGTLRDGDMIVSGGTHRVVTGQRIAALEPDAAQPSGSGTR
ncbi:MAG: efflux RND transporter periplasmic adaptor subunit [Pseudomonadota bacterium]